MAGFTTTDDLVTQALWLAGEPTNGQSDYQAQALIWMQLCYDTLLNGGTLGTTNIAQSAGLYEHLVDIPTTDWKWLRKFPPFAFNTTPAILGSGADVSQSGGPPPIMIGTVLVTNGSPTITFSIAPPVSVAAWRLKLIDQAPGVPNPPITIPRIVSHVANATTATLDAPWPQETQTASNFALFQAEYPLPSDFVRFCESPMVQGGWSGLNPPRLAIGDSEQVFDYWPLTEFNQGPPTAAARVTTNTIMLNRWDTPSYRIEFSYIYQPDPLAINIQQEPVVPLRFRNILALGSAMLMAHDKVDSRTGSLSSQFREVLTQLGQEYRKEQMAGSENMGRMLFRTPYNRRGLLRTASGLPLW
jgi:hypothetical protein